MYQSHTKLYYVWGAMKARCHNPNDKAYPRYGGRGITVCQEWRASYQPFAEWAYAHGYKHGLTIDRTDNDKGYCPENCRWVTMRENLNNRRSHHWITWTGERKTVAQWGADPRCKVAPMRLRIRLWRGWEFERALLTPTRKRKP